MKNNLYFKLFSNCFIVKGFSKSILCDTQRSLYIPIENDICNVLTEIDGKKIDQIYVNQDTSGISKINNFIEYLIQKEIGFFTEFPENYPKIDLVWKSPFQFTNAIIDWDNSFKQINNSIIKQLERLGCQALEIRSFEEISANDLEIFLIPTLSSRFQTIEITIPFTNLGTTEKMMQELVKNNLRITSIILFNAPLNKVFSHHQTNIYLVTKILNSKMHCGNIANSLFTLNIKSFTESLHHNSCLNRKISIDAEGNIKNCPSMPESFGNIKDTTLAEAIEKPGFKKYWNITKDQIAVCKDCEFRYICTDCRAYKEDPEDDYSKPLKCGYDPYTGVWSEWSTNPLKQKAIQYYGMEEIIKQE